MTVMKTPSDFRASWTTAFDLTRPSSSTGVEIPKHIPDLDSGSRSSYLESRAQRFGDRIFPEGMGMLKKARVEDAYRNIGRAEGNPIK